MRYQEAKPDQDTANSTRPGFVRVRNVRLVVSDKVLWTSREYSVQASYPSPPARIVSHAASAFVMTGFYAGLATAIVHSPGRTSKP